MLLVELAGVLIRYIPPRMISDIVERVEMEVVLLDDGVFYEESIKVALQTGCRGADSYYIGGC
ncbi:hypothetical protein QPL79_05890 [Ignisphaera sp. 4213-co]|uniref:Uncharacterized protein n=1 Tax=Ignisphaera cupida TaxID=3050454 RepID=A0ABD4Z6M9_9CREN|nr:hypothetical protein [Ignisphaera sp. 4213-co]MDK6028889.1 hypothetical protein [Ignisphaera sp. 4213-co]